MSATAQVMTVRVERYLEALRNIPASGGGGCHAALLRIANLGHHAGIDRDQIGDDLAAHVHGTRKVTAREISQAIAKAFASSAGPAVYDYARKYTKRSEVVDGEKFLNAICDRGARFTEADLWARSPVRIDWSPEQDAVEVLRRLYRPEDRLFIGSRFDAGAAHVQTVAEWITRFDAGAAIPEHAIPNPLSGTLGQTKDEKPSYRADSCVARFPFTVVEFDTMPREIQIQFWAGVKLPVVALIDSGGKSIHGWVAIDAASSDEWTERVEEKLFSLLTPMGADPACRNEARLSRMPGHFRTEKNKWQRILYLDPCGGQVLP